jgi:hypothetical protein
LCYHFPDESKAARDKRISGIDKICEVLILKRGSDTRVQMSASPLLSDSDRDLCSDGSLDYPSKEVSE